MPSEDEPRAKRAARARGEKRGTADCAASSQPFPTNHHTPKKQRQEPPPNPGPGPGVARGGLGTTSRLKPRAHIHTLPLDDDEEGAATQPDSEAASLGSVDLGRSTSYDGREPVVSRWLISLDFPSTARLKNISTVEIKHGDDGQVSSWDDGKELHRNLLGRIAVDLHGSDKQ
eukprot:COSAG01_NODE_27860_length_675_cov_0.800347_1_plen_172_part_01